MLKASARIRGGRTLLILGLSAENLRRLADDQPVRVALDEFGAAGVDLLLFAGETEESMGRDLHAFIGPDTEVSIDPRLYGGSD